MSEQVPLRSMTGFGAAGAVAEIGGGPVRLAVELRSVNQRFLEVKIRQPFGGAAEHALRRQIEARLRRGRIDVLVHVQGLGDAASLGVADLERVREVIVQAQQVEALAPRLGHPGLAAFTAIDVLRLVAAKAGAGGEAMVQAPAELEAVVEAALAALCTMREQEGAALATAIAELADGLQGQVAELRAARVGEAERAFSRIREKIAALCEKAGVSPAAPERIAQEVAALVQRGDIEEELARIDSHLSQLRAVLAAEAQTGQGKTLDFLAQELFRELTTIGSKITSHSGSAVVIAAKASVERIREQVQNVE